MMQLFQRCVLVAACCFAGLFAISQDFSVIYDFANVTSTVGRTDPTPVPTAAGISFGSFTAVAPAGNPNGLADNPNASGRFSFTGWPTGATNGSNAFTGAINTGQYYQVVLTPENYYTLNLDSIAFTIQRSGTGVRQFAVRWSVDNYAANLPAAIEPANSLLQVVANNVFQIADAATTAQNGCKVYLPAATNITSPLTIRLYGWNAEGTGGTFSIDNVAIAGKTTLSPTAPVMFIDPAALTFPATAIGASASASYAINASKLTDPLVITAAAPFTVATNSSGPFDATATIAAANANGNHTVYVRFTPTAAASYSQQIANSSNAATTRQLKVSGEGINPNNFTFNFNQCTDAGVPGSGFVAYSVSGSQRWSCTQFGNGSNGVNMNGYSNGPLENEDWLISPPLNLANVDLPVLRFWSRGEFTGPTLQLLISTDYNGSSDPNTATWTELNGDFPLLNNTWKLTDGIDLSAYKTFSNVFVAFKYTSSPELGAARWSVDDIDITNRTTLFAARPSLLDFGEASAGTQSAPLAVSLTSIGYGDVTVLAPAGFQVSKNSTTFGGQVVYTQGEVAGGAMMYVRFAPATKQLAIEGQLRFTGTALDTVKVQMRGTSYPKAETLDAGTYNLSFFGSNPTNNPTQEKINTQVANMVTIFNKLNLDVVGVQEISNDVALDSLVKRLPNRKALVANRWSYSFYGPDPNFPPQKIGFIYDTTTMQLVSSRVMFTGLYDSARFNQSNRLADYPGGAINFWSGGRLPFMATFNVTIAGQSQQVRVINLHAKSAADANSYNRRVYDVRVLRDTLNALYPNDKIFILGDFNDRLSGSNFGTANSPYKIYVDDGANFNAITLPLDQSGAISYLGSSTMIDHVMVTNELTPDYIASSAIIEDPRGYISGYNGTSASDHLPVYARFIVSGSLPVTFLAFDARLVNKEVILNWSTATEVNNQYFAVERSTDNRVFTELGRMGGAVNSTLHRQYTFTDGSPQPGANYYRIRQVDMDGATSLSRVEKVMWGAGTLQKLTLFPNPVTTLVQLKGVDAGATYSAAITAINGKTVLMAKGSVADISRQLTQRLEELAPGMYLLQLAGGERPVTVQFLKK